MMHLPAKVEVIHSKTFVAHTKVGHGGGDADRPPRPRL